MSDTPDIMTALEDLAFECSYFKSVLSQFEGMPSYIEQLAKDIGNFDLSTATSVDLSAFIRKHGKVKAYVDRTNSEMWGDNEQPGDELLEMQVSLGRMDTFQSILLDFGDSDFDEAVADQFWPRRLARSLSQLVESVAAMKGVAILNTTSSSNLQFDFHPEVSKVAFPYLQSGHYRNALEESARELYRACVEKAQRPKYKRTGTPLLQFIFRNESPILRISDDKDAQQGAMYLFSGMMMGIRNTRVHNDGQESDTDLNMVLEWLAFLSALYRLLDQANYEEQDASEISDLH